MIQGTKFKLECTEQDIDEWANPLIYEVKTYEYSSLLCKGLFLLNAPLFTLKFFAVLKCRVKRKSQTLA